MNEPQPSHMDLAAAIRSERAGVEALVEVLTAERLALGKGDTDRLAEMAPRKRELLLHLAHLGEQRNRLLECCGASADRRGMERLLDENADAMASRSEWSALLELTQRAHRLNQDNGAFIEAGMRANQQALAVLTSASSKDGAERLVERRLDFFFLRDTGNKSAKVVEGVCPEAIRLAERALRLAPSLKATIKDGHFLRGKRFARLPDESCLHIRFASILGLPTHQKSRQGEAKLGTPSFGATPLAARVCHATHRRGDSHDNAG